MLRPRKKYTVYDLQKLKGERCLTHIHVKSPEEAAAAKAAGVDLISCSNDPPQFPSAAAANGGSCAEQFPLRCDPARHGDGRRGHPHRVRRSRSGREFYLHYLGNEIEWEHRFTPADPSGNLIVFWREK